MSITTAPRRNRPLGLVGTVVDERIRPIQHGYLNDRSESVAVLARLRRGVAKPVEDVPELWGITGDERLYAGVSPNDEGTVPAEAAAHCALTLYAVHQQSHRDKPMHVTDRTFGAAVRRLMTGAESDEAIRRRFVQAGSAHTLDALAHRLRELITLLRREAIELDYGLLADQLYRAQQPGGMRDLRRAWGRDFHAHRTRPDEKPAGESEATGAGSNTDPETTDRTDRTETTDTTEDDA